MPGLRIRTEDHETMAVDDLVALGDRLSNLSVAPAGPRSVSISLAGTSFPATVVPLDSAGLGDAQRLTLASGRGAHVVVGNKLSEEARAHLTDAGWSWFDRRYGAHLAHGTHSVDVVFVANDPLRDDDAPPLLASPSSDGPIRGRAGISYAAALLLAPEDPPSLRAIAREINMSPTAISNAAKLLVAQGLVVDGRPALPDLFWALAAVWRPVTIAPVAAAPDPSASSQLAFHLDDLDATGWALGGDRAALELGAPVFATDDRPWFWVPTQTEARRAQRALGTASMDDRAATVAVPPTPLVVTRRTAPTKATAPWPLAHPLFVALDLARDPGRGREILEQWQPEGIARVWS